jgi:hypothetical protein
LIARRHSGQWRWIGDVRWTTGWQRWHSTSATFHSATRVIALVAAGGLFLVGGVLTLGSRLLQGSRG